LGSLLPSRQVFGGRTLKSPLKAPQEPRASVILADKAGDLLGEAIALLDLEAGTDPLTNQDHRDNCLLRALGLIGFHNAK